MLFNETCVQSICLLLASVLSLSRLYSCIYLGVSSCSSPGSSSRLSLNSSVCTPQSYTSIQLLGLEMLLHYFFGSQASAAAVKSSLQLSLGKAAVHSFLL